MLIRSAAACVLFVALLTACRGLEPPAGGPPPVVTITADDDRFIAPDTVAAGLTTLHLVTRGAALHQVALARIGGGHSFAEFLDAMRAPPPPPEWIDMAGGVNPPVAGGEASVTMELEPGRYALLCLIPDSAGLPHVVRGRYREMVVVRRRVPRAAEPAVTDTLILSDGTIAASAPLSRGRHSFRVVNRGPSPHEVTFVRLAPGRTEADMMRWLAHPAGPPPGTMLGGVFGIRTDQHAFVTVDFTPGEYLIFCSLLAREDGKPYYLHGMLREVTVR